MNLECFILDIEHHLIHDTNGVYLKSTIQQLRDECARITSDENIRHLLPKNQILHKYLLALHLSEYVLNTVWRCNHNL